jgi:HSP20 family protein
MARALINFNDIWPTTRSYAISKKSPFGSIFNEWDDFFGNQHNTTSFTTNKRDENVNVDETETSYKISVLAPGRQKKDFNISLEGERLSVSLNKQEEKGNSFAQSSLNYAWKTPSGTTSEDVFATYEAGILKILVNKPESEQVITETIKVN